MSARPGTLPVNNQQECLKTWAQATAPAAPPGEPGALGAAPLQQDRRVGRGLYLLTLPRAGAPALWTRGTREGGTCSGNGHSGLGFSAEFDHFGEENVQCGLCCLTDLAVGSVPLLSVW